MSSIYLTEPPTQGKILVHTTFGDIDIEIWPKEAPLACRNFIQLCLEGYYENTIVHRIVKGFMVQMGDPTGSGSGGKSIWNRPFKDEFHGRLKFSHRGLVAMANENAPNTNQSQFFITLDSCEWLNRKHTIFGKVTGSTIFNVLRIGDVETDENDKPIDELRILKTEVLWNPMEDIVPRAIKSKTENSIEDQSSLVDKSKLSKEKAKKKDFKLLSFADESEEDSEEESQRRKKKETRLREYKQQSSAPYAGSSSHNAEEKVISIPAAKAQSNEDSESDAEGFERKMRDKLLMKKKKFQTNNAGEIHEASIVSSSKSTDDRLSMSEILEQKKNEKLKEKSAEYLALRDQLLQSKRAIHVITGEESEKMHKKEAFNEMATPLEQRRMRYKKRKQEFGDRSEETLKKLQMFTQNLRASKKNQFEQSSESLNKINGEENGSSYHGQVLENEDIYQGGDDKDVENWYDGKLKFKKHIDDKYRSIGSDGRSLLEYEVIDTRDGRRK